MLAMSMVKRAETSWPVVALQRMREGDELRERGFQFGRGHGIEDAQIRRS